jgi:hypothetical protein
MSRAQSARIVLGVVALRQLLGDLDQLEADQFEAARLQTRQDRTDQPALDTVGLDDDQGAFHAHVCGAYKLQVRDAEPILARSGPSHVR